MKYKIPKGALVFLYKRQPESAAESFDDCIYSERDLVYGTSDYVGDMGGGSVAKFIIFRLPANERGHNFLIVDIKFVERYGNI